MSPTDSLSLSLPQLRQAIHQALKHWHVNHPLDDGLEQLFVTQAMARRDGGNVRKAARQLLHETLADLAIEQARPVAVVRLHFLDRHQVMHVANQLNIAEITVHKDQKLAIERLAELIRAREVAARADHAHHLLQRLESPSYRTLVGVDNPLSALYPLLTTQDAPWILAIEGMGGIGKTSLAHALASRVIREATFADVGWVTARQDHFDLAGGLAIGEKPALTADALVKNLAAQLTNDDALVAALPMAQQLDMLADRLRSVPHLVIVDNLETLTDVASILPILRRLVEPTKFLLTSRHRYETEPGLFHFQVPDLSEAETLRLVRQEAVDRNLPHLLQASDDELRPVYEMVGGNPLAIRLVVGQTHVHSLDAILDDLATAQSQTVENLYTFIYRRAWNLLDDAARRVWLQMPLLIGRNANVPTLAKYTGYDVGTIRRALGTLVHLNLIHAQGTLNDRSYSIHNLTRAFLLQGVAKWQ